VVDDVAVDTDASVSALLTARWRTMTPAERAEVVEQACFDVERLARAGIAALHPDYSEREVCHELARRRYGSALADAAYSTSPESG
jgi:hypothetical protein